MTRHIRVRTGFNPPNYSGLCLGSRLGRLGRRTQRFGMHFLAQIGGFLQHILPPYFARVRTFGWLHPAAKVRGNRVRALLGQPPVLTPAEKDTWQPTNDPQLDGTDDEPANAADPTEVPARACAPLCPHCRKVMRRVGSWKAGQLLPLPNRPP